VDALAQRLFASLDAEQRAETCVPYDHPLRQYHNRGVMGGGRDILFGFSRNQRKILTDLMYAGCPKMGEIAFLRSSSHGGPASTHCAS
jgi:hypothetical protein